MMAVELHSGEPLLPSQFVPDTEDGIRSEDHDISNHNKDSALNDQFSSWDHSTEIKRTDKDDEFFAELTRQMAHFMSQDNDDKLNFSATPSRKFQMSWDSLDSPQSTLWPPLGSSYGTPEEASLESSPPATPGDSKDSSWDTSEVVEMFEKMNFDDTGHSKYHHNRGIQNFNNSNIGLCSSQSLVDQQIRAIQFSRMKQEQVLKQRATAYQNGPAQLTQASELKAQTPQLQNQKKVKAGGAAGSVGNGRRTRPPALFSSNAGPSLRQQLQTQQQGGSGMRALFLGGSQARNGSCGTGVFLPRGTGTAAPSEPRKKPGCSTVLIPARVVQALQLHFEQMAATSGPKAGGSFPPLHDVLVSNRDGMYLLQKRQSRKESTTNMENENENENEMSLPQEWTY